MDNGPETRKVNQKINQDVMKRYMGIFMSLINVVEKEDMGKTDFIVSNMLNVTLKIQNYHQIQRKSG